MDSHRVRMSRSRPKHFFSMAAAIASELGAAGGAVGVAKDDRHERRALGRLDDDVRGDARVAVFRGLVEAEHADG
eukprot:3906087-Prymnesium_polylepis.1